MNSVIKEQQERHEKNTQTLLDLAVEPILARMINPDNSDEIAHWQRGRLLYGYWVTRCLSECVQFLEAEQQAEGG